MQTDTLENGAGALSRYREWIDSAPKGRAIAYYLGDLAHDRDADHFPGATAAKRKECDDLNILGIRVLKDARDGIVSLVQRKHASSVYEYIAIMKRPKRDVDPVKDTEVERTEEPA